LICLYLSFGLLANSQSARTAASAVLGTEVWFIGFFFQVSRSLFTGLFYQSLSFILISMVCFDMIDISQSLSICL